MFNVCPGCGEYTAEKEVLDSPTRAVCSACGHVFEFLSLPLFVVTGASGSGKTTIALELLKSAPEFVVLDQDILWCDAFDKPDDDYNQFRNTWLRMIKNIHQAGKPVVLFGSSIPKQFESCTERRYLNKIHYLALICQPEELERRLVARPKWRKSGTPENLKRMLDFNQWLCDNASTTDPPLTLLDTTGITIEETVKSIHTWLSYQLTSVR